MSKTTAVLLAVTVCLFIVAPAQADDDERERNPIKNLTDLIERCEKQLADASTKKTPAVTKKDPVEPKHGPRELPPGVKIKRPHKTEPEKIVKDTRPERIRRKETAKLATQLLTAKVEGDQLKKISLQLKQLDMVGVLAFVHPLLMGKNYSGEKRNVAWSLIKHYKPELLGEKEIKRGSRFIVHGETHLRFRNWLYAMAKKDMMVKQVVNQRVMSCSKWVYQLEKSKNQEMTNKLKGELLNAGEEHVALAMIDILRNRVTKMDKDQMGKTRHIANACMEVFQFYAGFKIEDVDSGDDDDDDGGRGRGRGNNKKGGGWYAGWLKKLDKAKKVYWEKCLKCAYCKKVSRRGD